jgi:hypothetical protein
MKAKRLVRAILMVATLGALALPVAAQRGRNDWEDPARKGAARDAELKAKPRGTTEVFFCETAATDCRASSATFELKRVRDLFVFVTWPNGSGDHVQTVEFYLPNGSLYVKTETPFRLRPGKPRAWPVPGSKVQEKYLTTSRGVPTVVSVLPVEGTYITQRSLTGDWGVRVLLDGREVSFSRFTLEPAAQR